jgi:hypothetical protein
MAWMLIYETSQESKNNNNKYPVLNDDYYGWVPSSVDKKQC